MTPNSHQFSFAKVKHRNRYKFIFAFFYSFIISCISLHFFITLYLNPFIIPLHTIKVKCLQQTSVSSKYVWSEYLNIFTCVAHTGKYISTHLHMRKYHIYIHIYLCIQFKKKKNAISLITYKVLWHQNELNACIMHSKLSRGKYSKMEFWDRIL